ncbi:PP2C family protein-serine/threonine phosphatase [Streptomyces sp. RFCAC02]|uniref:PP2C family protein-serine/threonine phosphatase n=1 Tax=Streptomyces sp. RFCAC02 TaxID=2499143 RepID=UPI001F0F5238|nr:PP2C family protein-serine/threonine phosphatase [Streptomyces sp. RFCAC02]
MKPTASLRVARWRRRRRDDRAVRPLRAGRRAPFWLLPALLLVAIVVGDWNSSGELRIVTWIVLVPGIAAALCGVVMTALFAAAAAVCYYQLDRAWGYQYAEGPADFWLVVAGGLLAVLASWLRRRAQHRLLGLENGAEATRLAVLRPLPRRTGNLSLASAYLAADADARVGGDFFDVQPSPHGTRVLLGDIQGKGTTAVDAASALLGTFREAGYYEELGTVAERLDNRMRRHNQYSADLGQPFERFATAVLIGFPAEDEGWIDMVNFGHPAPLVLGRSGVRPLPEGNGPPVGLSTFAGELPPVVRVPFERSETLLLFTDGVTEARDRAGRFLPVAARLAAYLADDGDTAPLSVVRAVEDAVILHTHGRLQDDTAILAVRAEPGAGTAPPAELAPDALPRDHGPAGPDLTGGPRPARRDDRRGG